LDPRLDGHLNAAARVLMRVVRLNCAGGESLDYKFSTSFARQFGNNAARSCKNN
jgi:acyl-CoA synthetase (NDP forming)